MRTRGERNGRYMIGLAGVILAVGGCLSLEVLWFLSGCVTTPGVVVANRKSVVQIRGQATDVFHVVVEFADDAGIKYELEHGDNLPEAVPLGTAISIHYPPGNVDKARLGGSYLWYWSLVCLVSACFLAAVGGFFILLARFLVRMGVPMRTY